MTTHSVPAGLPYRSSFKVDHIITIDVSAEHGENWFPVRINNDTRMPITLYLNRRELRLLRDRLDEIDRLMPEPEKT